MGGTGGTSVVFLATLAGQRHAIKVLRPELRMLPDLCQSLRNQWEKLERLRSIPHLERLVNFMVLEEAGPVLVLECLDKDALSKSIPGGMAKVEVLRMAANVGEALRALHNHEDRYWHSDVKPGNVMNDSRRGWTLIDCGYAQAIWSATRLDSTGRALEARLADPRVGAGTLPYMSPEVAGLQDTRWHADEWSFLVMLYECFTGIRPFGTPRSRAEVLELTRRPVDAALLQRAGVPPELRDLLVRGLDARLPPQRRLAGIGEVVNRIHEELARCGESRVRTAAGNIPEHPPLVGRDAEMAEVSAALREGRPVVILGMAGAGKTALAESVARSLLREGEPAVADGAVTVPVWTLGALPTTEAVVELTWKTLVRARIGGLGGGPGRGRRWGVDELARRLEHLRLLLIFDGVQDGVDAAGPLLAALRNVARIRLAITCCSAHAPLAGTSTLRLVLHGLSTTGSVDGGWSPAEVLLRQAARDAGAVLAESDPAIAALCRAANGVPAILERLARLLVVLPAREALADLRGVVAVSDDGASVPWHTSIEAVVECSLRRLSPQQRAFLADLTVFAGGAEQEAIRRVLPAGDRSTAQLLAAQIGLRDSGLLSRAGTGSSRVSLNDVVLHVAAQGLDPGRRHHLHLRHAAYFVESAWRAPMDAANQVGAAWFDLADRENENLARTLATLVAEDRALALVAMIRRLAPYWWTRGLFAEARTWVNEALCRSARLSPKWRLRLLAAAGTLAQRSLELELARTRHGEALHLARSLGRGVDEVMLLTLLGISHQLDVTPSHLARAEALHLESIELAERRALPGLRAFAQVNLASALKEMDRHQEATALVRDAHAWLASQSRPPAPLLAMVERLLGEDACRGQRHDEAVHLLGRALSRQSMLGDEFESLQVILWLGIVDVSRGFSNRGRVLLESTLRGFERIQRSPLPHHLRHARSALAIAAGSEPIVSPVFRSWQELAAFARDEATRAWPDPVTLPSGW